MKVEVYLGGALAGVISEVQPGESVPLALRMVPDEPAATAEPSPMEPAQDMPCHCPSGKLFRDCHGAAADDPVPPLERTEPEPAAPQPPTPPPASGSRARERRSLLSRGKDVLLRVVETIVFSVPRRRRGR